MAPDKPIAEARWPALLIDGSAADVFAGVPDGSGSRLVGQPGGQPALEGLFPAVERALNAATVELGMIRGFIYCQGPGSVLGLRLCAMAVETWRRTVPGDVPCFGYDSLQLTAALLLNDQSAPSDALLVSDWKRGAWNAVRIEGGCRRPTETLEDPVLKQYKGPIFHLPQRKGWQPPPENAIPLSYEPERLPEVMRIPGILNRTQGVELHASAAPAFRKWQPERHRAPPPQE
ncbi:MAG: hypothetical protein ACLFS4_06475 [Opitutales bacterium]